MTPPSRIQWLSDLIRLEIALWDRINARLKQKHDLPLAFFESLFFIGHSRDGSLRARRHRAEAAAHDPGQTQQQINRRLAKVDAALNQNDHELLEIMGGLESYGLRLEQIARIVVVVDDHDDAGAETKARNHVGDARRDRKNKSERRVSTPERKCIGGPE